MKRRTRKTVVLVDNPFVSESQKGWMYSNKPEMAKEWQAHTPKGNKLPHRVSNTKRHLACNKGKIVGVTNTLLLDPTRTLTLRRSFFQGVQKRFARLKGMLFKLIVSDDVFGLKEQ